MVKAADRAAEAVETMARLDRMFTAYEIEALIDEPGEDNILELSVPIEMLGKSRLLDIL